MKKLVIAALFLTGCASHTATKTNENMQSMQIIDRNGFTETISLKERLSDYKKVDFCAPQPYQKVLRVFEKDLQKKNKSIITSYHINGYLWQYLEAIDGRANGMYREYYPNSQLRLEAQVIEGMADINEKAQASWLFEGKSSVFDEQGQLVAEIFYEKGKLEGTSKYYFPNGTVKKTISYKEDLEEGESLLLDETGACVEKNLYHLGKRQGTSSSFWKPSIIRSKEEYEDGFLLTGVYYSQEGSLLSEVTSGQGKQCLFKDNYLYKTVSISNGIPEGEVRVLDEKGRLVNLYHVRNGQKNGEEFEYYTPLKPTEKDIPKLYILWQEDKIVNVKTWYENGILESQREMNDNKKHGLSFAWYQDSSLMLMEEYDEGKLVKGSYYKRGEKAPQTTVENGKGTAIIYDKEGRFAKKILYEGGKPAGEFY